MRYTGATYRSSATKYLTSATKYRSSANCIVHGLVLVITLAVVSACDSTPPEAKWVAAVSKRIGSDYQALLKESETLASSTATFCEQPVDLSPARTQWLRTMDAWQQVQWVRFGPILENNDDWKIQFWPDKKNIVARKVGQLLEREQAIDAATLDKASVVVQGLTALELLLFDDNFSQRYGENTPQAEKQCQLLRVTSEYLVTTVNRISEGWQDDDFQSRWLATATTGSDSTQVDAESQIVAAMLSQMEKVKLDKLGGPLGYKNRNRQPNGYFAESWRSHSSLANIQANLLALARVIDAQDGYDLRRLLAHHGAAPLADQIQAQVNKCLSLLSDIDKPLSEAVMDSAYKPRLDALHQAVGELNSLLKSGLATALQIKLGFNSNDGD